MEGRECASYIGPAAERGERPSSDEGWVMERRGRRENGGGEGRQGNGGGRKERRVDAGRGGRIEEKRMESQKGDKGEKRRIEGEEGRNQLCVIVCKLCYCM